MDNKTNKGYALVRVGLFSELVASGKFFLTKVASCSEISQMMCVFQSLRDVKTPVVDSPE